MSTQTPNNNDNHRLASALVPSQQHEEEALLANIGSTITSHSTYETQVLREATLSYAPSLSGIGFPDLKALAPSFHSNSNVATASSSASASSIKRQKINNDNDKINDNYLSRDIPHMLIVLSKLRNEIQKIEMSSHDKESRQFNLLRMKYQILLSFLAANTNLTKEEVQLNILHEKKLEENRKNKLQKSSRNGITQKERLTRGPRSGREDSSVSISTSKLISSHTMGTNNVNGTKRLEYIKKHGQYEDDDIGNTINIFSESKTASFGKQALEARAKNIQIAQSRKHNSIMALKRKMVENSGDQWIDPEILYKQRMERIQRRKDRGSRRKKRIRNGAFNDLSSSSITPSRDHDEEIAEENKEVDVEKLESNHISANTTVTVTVDNNTSTINSSKSTTKKKVQFKTRTTKTTKSNTKSKKKTQLTKPFPLPTKTSNITDTNTTTADTATSHEDISAGVTALVTCAICNSDIKVPNKFSNDIDSFLSQHMSTCTGKPTPSTSRRLRSSSRKSAISYVEHDNDEYDDGDDHITEDTIIDNESKNNTKVDEKFVDDVFIGDIESSDDDDDNVDEKFASDATTTEEEECLNYVRDKTIDDFDEDDYEDRVDEWIENGIEMMKEMDEQDNEEEKPGEVTFPGGLYIPAWLNNRLFGYQRTALRWMWELHSQGAGGIIGDEMGLGKTVQMCSYLGTMAASRQLKSVLIIVPATVMMHWLNELAIWAPGLRRILIHKSGERVGKGPNRSISRQMLRSLDKWLHRSRVERLYEPIDERDLEENGPDSFVGTGIAVVTTFENIRRSTDVWVSHDWSYVVMDEGQKIRNPDAEVTMACKRLRTPHRLLLSGTPIQNDLKEFWSLLDFVFPGRLGVLPTFLSEFADPIRRGGYANASPMQVQLAYRCALVLRDLINPYMLRRQKKDIKEVSRMPGKTEQVLFCKLSQRQRRMYEAYLLSDEVQRILKNRSSTSAFRPIITLRKICNHPHLVCGSDPASYESFLTKGFNDDGGDDEMADISSDEENAIADLSDDEEQLVQSSGKLEVLAQILPLWKKQGHRVLIFSQWTKTLDIIQQFTNSKGWEFGRMDGKTNVGSRQKMVDSFNNDNTYFGMLLTTKTGGVGLNLIGANRVVLFDPDWNPASDNQARERAWRFGQKNPVTVYRLITAGTIEEKIYQRQIFKTAISNQVLQDPRQRRMFSYKALKDLFTLKPDTGSASNGGGGVTETGQLTKGRGVVDIDLMNSTCNDNDEGGSEVTESQDNKVTLEDVLKTKGLAGVFDHDIVDKPFLKKSLTEKEREAQAKKAASEAVRKLAQSFRNSTAFEPTWTGSTETDPRRFGNVNVLPSKRKSRFLSSSKTENSFDTGFGGAQVVGHKSSSTMTNAISCSNSLLSQLRQRRQEVVTVGQDKARSDEGEEADQNVVLMKRIRAFIITYTEKLGEGPQTDDILKEFEKDKLDAIIFKSILKTVATFSRENQRWHLK